MDHPRAGILGIELDNFSLGHTDEHGVGGIPGGSRCAATFGAGDDELISVEVNWVMIHSEIDEAETHATALANDQRSGGRRRKTIEGEPIEFHGGSVGNGVVGEDGPLLENDGEIVIGVRSVGLLRMNDEGADETD